MNQESPLFGSSARNYVIFATETPEEAQKLMDAFLKIAKDVTPNYDHQLIEDPRKKLSFGYALEALKAGWTARLPHWSDDVRIILQRPDENSKMTHPYLYVESRYGCVPWKETFVELLSTSWEIAPYEPLHIEPCCCCGQDPDSEQDSCDKETSPAE